MFDRRTTQIDNQLFDVKYDEKTGFYKITNPTSDLIFDVSSGRVANETPVLGWWEHHGSCNQDWVLESDNEGYYTIMSRCSSKVLDATSSDKLIIFRSHGGDNQKWQLINEEAISSSEN